MHKTYRFVNWEYYQLMDINLEIKAGETIALTGANF
jgi:ABC-type bacteriocin/lantibiotic exporter with double-glycine peptidase domain